MITTIVILRSRQQTSHSLGGLRSASVTELWCVHSQTSQQFNAAVVLIALVSAYYASAVIEFEQINELRLAAVSLDQGDIALAQR